MRSAWRVRRAAGAAAGDRDPTAAEVVRHQADPGGHVHPGDPLVEVGPDLPPHLEDGRAVDEAPAHPVAVLREPSTQRVERREEGWERVIVTRRVCRGVEAEGHLAAVDGALSSPGRPGERALPRGADGAEDRGQGKVAGRVVGGDDERA